jgi:hypothetical protein
MNGIFKMVFMRVSNSWFVGSKYQNTSHGFAVKPHAACAAFAKPPYCDDIR